VRVDQFDFTLPEALIATRPASPRDSARLLAVGDGLADRRFDELPELLRPGDLLVLNDAKVIPAQLAGRRGAARVELTLHRRLGPGRWRAFAKPAKRLKTGDRIDVADGFAATVAARDGPEVELDFGIDDAGFDMALARSGAVPLPPYIRARRATDARDAEDYQTVYARTPGAVAAPTAGLHFTPALLAALEARGVARTTITLHVGAGTFLPVTAEDTVEHRMHAERIEIGAEAAEAVNRTRRAGGRVVAVGTTSLRSLESVADGDGGLRPFHGETEIFITPGWRFRCADLLLTNFHLPRSTLFMLVCAFAGSERMKAAYAHAIAEGYRFYSYGDASLLARA
jgi:S-adenosylmethionine:tRNA ribosyltransferase-isomerase